MGSQQKKQYVCLNILGFKNPSVSPEDFRSYMVNVHAPHVAGLMEKYGFIHWTMTHATEESPEFMDQIRGGPFNNMAPFDVCVTIVLPNIDAFLQFKADPFFRQSVGPDHQKFADIKRSQMFIGYYTPLMLNGKYLGGELNESHIGNVHNNATATAAVHA